MAGIHCQVSIQGDGMTTSGSKVIARSKDPGDWRLHAHPVPTAGGKHGFIFRWCGGTNDQDAPVLTLDKTNVIVSSTTGSVSNSQLWTLEDSDIDVEFVSPTIRKP